ncbi:MAG: DUF192 domain-containing protein [Methylocystaceae bacterium]|nr:DUF192 domain-containing protein [Methylocystaceae bacterium]
MLSFIKKLTLFCLIIATYCAFSLDAHAQGKGVLTIVTREGPVSFTVEYAITPEEKAKGLMFRKTMDKKHGMLFIYQKPTTVTMWMKDTPMSLDMFFIKRNGLIRYIEEKTQPNSTRHINSGGQVMAVLELRAGSAEDYGIKVGDQVILGK